MTEALVPLPTQPEGTTWPTTSWPTGEAPPDVGLDRLVDDLVDDTARYGTTHAVAVVHRGRLVAERYAGTIEHWDADDEPVGPETRLLSWSMAKSVLHAAVGILVGDGRLSLHEPAPVPAWRTDADDPRAGITLEHLLTMRDGLAFREEYVDGDASDVIEMLFGGGQHDVAAFAAARPAVHRPGEVFNYSSGTSNIVSRLVGDVVGGGAEGYESFLRTELFEPLGMRSPEPRFDEAGTFIASSSLYATALDYARFGLLYLRDGVWEGRRLLPDGWVDHGRRARSFDAENDRWHGAQWWVLGDDVGTFWANGYEGQFILCVPALDLVAVRLGKTAKADYPALRDWRDGLTAAFAETTGAVAPPR